MKNIAIIGGGIIGVCSAYYLRKAGHRVTIFDQGEMTDGCSFGNAGMIVPSHIIPLASPGMIARGVRWMFNPESPFFVRPRLNGSLIRWGYLFYRNATRANVEKAAPALKAISVLSKSLYQQLSTELPFDYGYHERGLLMLYQTTESAREEQETAHLANRHGVEAHVLSQEEVQKLEPDVKVNVKGGVFFPGDAHLNPRLLLTQLIDLLRTDGVDIRTGVPITGFVSEGTKLKAIKTADNEINFDEVVVAAGSWSGLLCSKFGLSLPMQAGKGYSFTVSDMIKNVRIPSIFIEARVAVTPMGNSLRFGGTMEISGIDHGINMKRVKGIRDSIRKYYPEMEISMPESAAVWHGLRPCSPDGLPYLGRLKSLTNVIVATGHSMMGLSLAAGTGKLVAEIAEEKTPSIDIRPFNPERWN